MLTMKNINIIVRSLLMSNFLFQMFEDMEVCSTCGKMFKSASGASDPQRRHKKTTRPSYVVENYSTAKQIRDGIGKLLLLNGTVFSSSVFIRRSFKFRRGRRFHKHAMLLLRHICICNLL